MCKARGDVSEKLAWQKYFLWKWNPGCLFPRQAQPGPEWSQTKPESPSSRRPGEDGRSGLSNSSANILQKHSLSMDAFFGFERGLTIEKDIHVPSHGWPFFSWNSQWMECVRTCNTQSRSQVVHISGEPDVISSRVNLLTTFIFALVTLKYLSRCKNFRSPVDISRLD